MDLFDLTRSLCALSAPSGYEDAVRDFAADYLAPYADEITADALGNLIAVRRCGRDNARRILLDAHADEIGLVVTGHRDGGFLSVAAVGGVDARMLPAAAVTIMTEPPRTGVIDTMPVHVLSADETDKAVTIDKLYIDTGLSDEEAQTIPVGTPVVFCGPPAPLGDDLLCGKALDDRSCDAILLKAFADSAALKLEADLYCVLSAQEEVGCRGAAAAANAIVPDAAIVVDVTHARTPDEPSFPLELGKGTAIGVGPNMNRALTDKFIKLAQQKNLSYQIEVCPGGDSGTNARAIQISRCGVATALLSLPLRYMHTPGEVVKKADMQALYDLIMAYLETEAAQ